MHVLLDTNVLLDFLCDRQPFSDAAKEIWERVEQGEFQASASATTITTVFYLVEKELGLAEAVQAIREILSTFNVCPVDGNVLKLALSRQMRDYEDAVQDAAAECASIPVIVTRNGADFTGATRRIIDPVQFLTELDSGTAPHSP